MSEVTFKPPPNLREIDAPHCGSCRHFAGGYDGNHHCNKYPTYVDTSNDPVRIYDGIYETTVCDDWEAMSDE